MRTAHRFSHSVDQFARYPWVFQADVPDDEVAGLFLALPLGHRPLSRLLNQPGKLARHGRQCRLVAASTQSRQPHWRLFGCLVRAHGLSRPLTGHPTHAPGFAQLAQDRSRVDIVGGGEAPEGRGGDGGHRFLEFMFPRCDHGVYTMRRIVRGRSSID